MLPSKGMAVFVTLILTTVVARSNDFKDANQMDIIVDSEMSRDEALAGVSPDCPEEILMNQRVIQVDYVSFDGEVHRGQIVVHKDLVDDVKHVFAVAQRENFPIQSAIPISDKRFLRANQWNDDLSMDANNTSCFNYRPITGGRKLSNHSLGRAVDINPQLNPYVKGETILPRGAVYRPNQAGTVTADGPIVRAFLERGWEWGGNWTSLKDYQHFEKPAP